MKNYRYQNDLISKKQLRQLLAWSFTNYDSMQACSLADELKFLGFRYASKAGISISIEDLKTPFLKNGMLEKANQEIHDAEKVYLKGKITDVERFQKIIDTWSLTSEALKNQVVYYFKNYDPLNSVYIMAFSGARGNLAQVRQLVGMRGLMSDPSGQIMNLAIKKNFREGLTVTDYLISGYGARKGIVDTALKTANSGYLTRRLIDVAQDIIIREKDCETNHSILFLVSKNHPSYDQVLGRVLNKSIIDLETDKMIANKNTQITPILIKELKEKNITQFYIRSPLTCNLYRSICQKCYGWDLANENLVDIGEAIGILAGQSIGEPGTQLTMRTFHTGGIFTSEIREKIISPVTGIVRFDQNLKTVKLRTTRGEDVLVTKSYGILLLIPDLKTEKRVEIEVLENTIIYPKNNRYILKNDVIGEVIDTKKQIITETKLIATYNSGEIFIPQLQQEFNLLNNNKVMWILSGQLYNSPINSFLNFYPDFKLNQYSYVFRTKIISHYTGSVRFINQKKSLSQRLVRIKNKKSCLANSELQKLKSSNNINNYLLNFNSSKYFVKINEHQSKYYLNLTRSETFGTLITNSFKTLTGGTLYYDYKNLWNNYNFINYVRASIVKKKYKPVIAQNTIIWLSEEVYKVNCEPNRLLVADGDFILKESELISGLFSKTSGLVTIVQKNNFIEIISIKSGLVYPGNKFKNTDRKVYYPGEMVLGNIDIRSISFCEHIIGQNTDQLLVRPIEIYELPHSPDLVLNSRNISLFNLNPKLVYSYKSAQFIKGIQNINLAANILTFKTNKLLTNNLSIELFNNQKANSVDFNIIEKLCLNNYMTPNLKYKDIQSCFLIQKNQFISSYTTLGYLEAITENSLEIVKIKTKSQISKQIFLISNNDCLAVKKEEIPNKKLNDFIISNSKLTQIGKIIAQNDKFFIIQHGQLYFFPNCNDERSEPLSQIDLEYKIFPANRVKSNCNTNRDISVNYQNILKLSIKKQGFFSQSLPSLVSLKSEFSKFFLKKNGKFYSVLFPAFFKKLSITKNDSKSDFNQLCNSRNSTRQKKSRNSKKSGNSTEPKSRTILLKSSKLISNQNKEFNLSKDSCQLTLVEFVEQPFSKSKKAFGLHSITEDYFEEDKNSVFCENEEFIEAGEIIGSLKREKEITGDIVQGLPRIEEILEARKKTIKIRRIPTNKKKGLLVRKTSLDHNFEFRKLATTISETDKVNPHKLLKAYFNYYGLIKLFLCDKSKSFKTARLINNFEGSYKSFKKVQLFILHSVQAVYKSQGVNINDKHLEVIIKQMTTRVLITYEGDTALSRREVIDLYHIQYINEILNTEKKQPAHYVPFLLGITKAALNNPSFISAASFQETTRVLTKAAIEGRIDWLRGLKENVIIGDFIPAGTGFLSYRKCFKTVPVKQNMSIVLN